MGDFRELTVWMAAHQLSLDCYRCTESWPNHERFGLTNQVRRAAVSIGSNIAEGSGRGSDRDFTRFLRMALGSANELESLLLVAEGLGYLKPEAHQPIHQATRRVRQMLTRLAASLQAK